MGDLTEKQMMKNFEQEVDRRDTQSLKWNRYKHQDIIPLWVADSEFRSPEPIQLALAERVKHGIFGYHNPYQDEAATEAVVNWLEQRYDWKIDANWLVWTPGVVPAFNVMLRAFCQKGDGVIVQTPNYPPILNAAKHHGLETMPVNTKWAAGRWQLDFEELERQAAKPNAKVFLLCNPMNPCGSVYTQQELESIEAICTRHKVKLCSDEIHADLILDPSESHIPAGSLSNIGSEAVTLMAASKTFNVAGFGVSFAVIQDPKVRTLFKQAADGICPSANNLGVIATKTAFRECEAWYLAQLDYLRGNQQYLVKALNEIPGLEYKPQAATYLAWINAEGLAVNDVQKAFEEAGVGPSPGKDFGWPNYVRINFACPRSMLERAIERLQQRLPKPE